MMKQYFKIKEENDSILFFRLGNFTKCSMIQACVKKSLNSHLLVVTAAGRTCADVRRAFHSCEGYIAALWQGPRLQLRTDRGPCKGKGAC